MKDVIIALDFENKEQTLNFLKQFDETLFVKVGMELFYGEGLDILKDIKALGHKIFLDLKLHDIPNTVKNAMRNLAKLDIDMINVHACGSMEMMRAAKEGLVEGSNGKSPLLIAVTQLTSTTEETMNKELLIPGLVMDCVRSYARNAQLAGLDGVVCSALEVSAVKEVCGTDFLAVTPGIRYASNDVNDQARITDPVEASRLGSDYIVVGRPITKAFDPKTAYQQFKKDFCGGN